jgi:hypothetical protein
VLDKIFDELTQMSLKEERVHENYSATYKATESETASAGLLIYKRRQLLALPVCYGTLLPKFCSFLLKNVYTSSMVLWKFI